MHNTLIAAGPGIRRGFLDTLPSGNADVAPEIGAEISGGPPSLPADLVRSIAEQKRRFAVLNRLVGSGRDHFRGRENDGPFRRGPRQTERFGEQRL